MRLISLLIHSRYPFLGVHFDEFKTTSIELFHEGNYGTQNVLILGLSLLLFLLVSEGRNVVGKPLTIVAVTLLDLIASRIDLLLNLRRLGLNFLFWLYS